MGLLAEKHFLISSIQVKPDFSPSRNSLTNYWTSAIIEEQQVPELRIMYQVISSE